MAASVGYTNVLGQVLMESRGGVDTEFIPDPLGNVVKCKNSAGSYTYSAEYWPYGEIQTSTGSNPSNFGYVGTWGYYKDSSNQIYVRARYYRPVQGRWMTVDPLWPRERAYGYCSCSPLNGRDPSGLQGCKVYVCSVNASSLRHQFICVEGPNGGCSMGMYHDGPGDGSYGNNCAQPGLTTCKMISTDCNYGSEVCACTRRFKNGSPGLWEYIKSGTCYGFTALMACCGGKGDRSCLIAMGCASPACGSISNGLPVVGPNDQCPPGYRKRVGGGWVVG